MKKQFVAASRFWIHILKAVLRPQYFITVVTEVLSMYISCILLYIEGLVNLFRSDMVMSTFLLTETSIDMSRLSYVYIK